MTNSAEELNFVQYVVEHLAGHPEQVKIERTEDHLGVLITLQLHREDFGKIIGKNGQTIKSIRTLLKVIGAKQNQRITLKVLEPEVAAEA